MEDDDIESILFICREVMVFKVPARQSNAGYRAAEWGDLGSPLWKGRMRIIERSSGCSIRLEDSQTGEVFAQAPYDVTGLSVEAVLDSSRYFVLRAEDQGRKAYIGLGFAERAESFDFNTSQYLHHRIHYSDRYTDDSYEYRHVILPKPLLKLIPKSYFEPDDSGVLRILSETEWRGIGITQSLGWEHYEVHAPEPHVLLFRRAKAPAAQPAKAASAAASKPAAKARK
ncbi:unnamed protein product [Rhizoctonia solani]|uniref:Cyclin-dependent kinases regulatory subunit n=1 Tax=Rhizoctonia solani TaxID=456999 RepID=A0A8H3BK66_9AGAM|nr:unnamed protein product [Rhizoctonia solani]CAE6457861.1 unnamed protein product [Rhizoctonia solani]